MLATALLAICLGAAAATPLNWRIVGGTVASPGQFPYIFSLRRIDGSHNCGGSFISEKWAITAGHCASGYLPSSLVIFAGINQLNDSNAIQIQLSQAKVHPGYNAGTIKHDIALLELAQPIEFSDRIQPIKLQKENFDDRRRVVVVGWGRTGAAEPIPNDLQYLVSATIPIEDCKDAWIGRNPVFDTEVCTLTQVGEGACNGDSGGPLVCEDGNGDAAVCGLVSWGLPCARGQPDVFTRVSSYYDWIQENMN